MKTDGDPGESDRLRVAVGIRTKGGGVLEAGGPDPILLFDSPLPVEATYDILNATTQQAWAGHIPITIELFAGDSSNQTYSATLGTFDLKGIPPVPEGPKTIEIKLTVNVDRVLAVSFLNPETRKYSCLGFIDLSTFELSEVALDSPVTELYALIHSSRGAPVDFFQNPKPRETGRVRRGQNISQALTIAFDEAFYGTQRELQVASFATCPTCAGSGARPGTTAVHCQACQGTGWKREEVKREKDGPLLRAVPCLTCESDGFIIPHPCHTCQGQTWLKSTRSLMIDIPACIDSGAVVRLLHLGEPGRYGGPPGHLDVRVNVANHPLFSRVGRDISLHLPVSAHFAKEGGQLRVPGVKAGTFFLLDLPPHTKSGSSFRVNCEDYTLTVIIETYHPFFLFALSATQECIKAVEDALTGGTLDLSSSVKKGGVSQAAFLDKRGRTGQTGRETRFQRDAQFYVRRGSVYADMGNAARALADFDKAIALDPNYADAYNQRSVVHLALNEPKKAIVDMNRALLLEPDSAQYHCHRGILYERAENTTSAMADYNKALELDRDHADAYDRRGGLYHVLGDLAKALADYDRALELKPDSAKIYLMRGLLHQRQGALTKALADLNRAVELDTSSLLALSSRGEVYTQLGDFEHALADANRAVEMSPKDAGAYNNRAYTHFLQNSFEEALADYDKALELDPKLVPCYNYRGRTYLKQARYEQAIQDFTKSLSLHPGDMYVQLWLGQAYQGLGETRRAIAAYRTILDSDADTELRQETQKHLADLG